MIWKVRKVWCHGKPTILSCLGVDLSEIGTPIMDGQISFGKSDFTP